MTSAFETPNNMQSQIKEFHWYNSQSLALEVQCGITRLEFPDSVDVPQRHWENLTVSCCITSGQMTLHDPPVTSLFSQLDVDRNHLVWEQLAVFPVKIRDLLLDALVSFTVSTPDGQVVGGTTMRLFDDAGCLKQGRQKLLFYFGQPADSTVILRENQTVGELYDVFSAFDTDFQLEKHYERYRLTNCVDNGKYDPRTEWLDRLMLKRIESFREGLTPPQHLRGSTHFLAQRVYEEYLGKPLEQLEMSTFSYLIIDMPTLSYPVRFVFRLVRIYFGLTSCVFFLGVIRREALSLGGTARPSCKSLLCA